MTPEERAHRALTDISKTLAMYGCELDAVVVETKYTHRQMGASFLIDTNVSTQVVVKALKDWTPPQNDAGATNPPTNVDTDSPE